MQKKLLLPRGKASQAFLVVSLNAKARQSQCRRIDRRKSKSETLSADQTSLDMAQDEKED